MCKCNGQNNLPNITGMPRVCLSCSSICSDEGLTVETSAFEFLHSCQFLLSTQLIKPKYLVILTTDTASQFLLYYRYALRTVSHITVISLLSFFCSYHFYLLFQSLEITFLDCHVTQILLLSYIAGCMHYMPTMAEQINNRLK